MAKSEQTIKVKALVNLKYDKNCFTAGEDLKVRVSDAKEMANKSYVKLLEEIPAEGESTENTEGN